jgi:hypothetical protein
VQKSKVFRFACIKRRLTAIRSVEYELALRLRTFGSLDYTAADWHSAQSSGLRLRMAGKQNQPQATLKFFNLSAIQPALCYNLRLPWQPALSFRRMTMCICVFSPGRTLQVDYAAESIRLSKGGRIDVLDILVTNHSQDPVDRVHIIYPQPLLGTERQGPPSISDITNTFLENQSEFNDFYKSDGARLSVQSGPDYAAVTIFIGDPQNILKDLALRRGNPGGPGACGL